MSARWTRGRISTSQLTSARATGWSACSRQRPPLRRRPPRKCRSPSNASRQTAVGSCGAVLLREPSVKAPVHPAACTAPEESWLTCRSGRSGNRGPARRAAALPQLRRRPHDSFDGRRPIDRVATFSAKLPAGEEVPPTTTYRSGNPCATRRLSRESNRKLHLGWRCGEVTMARGSRGRLSTGVHRHPCWSLARTTIGFRH